MSNMPGILGNGDILDLNGKVISCTEKNKILQTISELPVNLYSSQIQDAVHDSIITVISAETGSGKTTQVPKMLMGNYSHRPKQIVVTEPRVIAAISASNRVSQEKLSETGDPIYSIGHKIGYRTGREVLSSKQSDLIFVTDGLQLLRQYVTNIVPDILVMDEVHTFSVATEFLLSQIRDTLLTTNKKVKLVLMSATMDIDRIKDFFAPVSKQIPVFDIPGRTFPVNYEYKGRDAFFPSIMNFAKDEKNILTFVEGKKTIEQTITKLQKELPNYNIYPLHSELPIADQNKVLKKEDDKPVIIVATNVAQESITIDYINAVVDNGYCKVMIYDDMGVPVLHTIPVSKADSRQRGGRAGRVMEGEYVRACDFDFEGIEEFPKGEIENITLEKYILIALSIGFNPLKYLKTGKNIFVHRPNDKLIKITYDNLVMIGAITKKHEITKFGKELLNFPLEPTVGKMLKEGISRKCSGDMIDICAIINHKGFLSRGQDWKHLIKGTFKQDSDLIAQRELLNILIRREPLDSELIGKLKSKNYHLNLNEINLFQEYAHHGKEKMLFEVVDFTSIGVKQKRIYEILNTIKILKERLSDSGYPLEYVAEISQPQEKGSKDKKQNVFENITKSILAGMLNNIYVYNKKTKMLFNVKKGGFVQTDTSTMDLSEKAFYCGNPFILKGSIDDVGNNEEDSEEKDKNKDMKLLSFITKIDSAQIDEIGKQNAYETTSDVKFTTKVVGKTKRGGVKTETSILANLQREMGGVTYENVVKEIQREKQKEVLALEWLPDYLIANNIDFINYINSFKSSKGKINLNYLKSIISIFTQNLQHRIYPDKPQKTADGFSGDRDIFKDFLNSTIPSVVEFRKNPFKKEIPEIKELTRTRRETDMVESQTKQNGTKKLEKPLKPHAAEIAAGKVSIIDYLNKKSKYSKNKVLEFLERGVVTVSGIKATEETYVDPNNTDIEIDFIEMRVLIALERQERIKGDILSETEADEIRFDIESQFMKHSSKKKITTPSKTVLNSSEEDLIVTRTAIKKRSKEKKPDLPKTSLKHTGEKLSKKRKKLEDNGEIKVLLHKYLSKNNMLTTRLAQKYMLYGAIRVNGEVAKIGTEFNPQKDRIDIDHEKFKQEDKNQREKKEEIKKNKSI